MKNSAKENLIKFTELMAILTKYFKEDMGESIAELYYQRLKDYSIDQVEKAIGRAIYELKFMPKIVELVEFIGSGPAKLEDIATIQADLVIRAIRRIGGYRSVNFQDPVTKAVIERCFGGWIQMCEELMEVDEKWFRKDFAKYYQSYSRQNIRIKHSLPGRHEVFNQIRGYLEHIPEPIQVETALIEGFEDKDIKRIEHENDQQQRKTRLSATG